MKKSMVSRIVLEACIDFSPERLVFSSSAGGVAFQNSALHPYASSGSNNYGTAGAHTGIPSRTFAGTVSPSR